MDTDGEITNQDTNEINDNDDDDVVIKELDVYLAKSLINNLYLFQYPVRPNTLTYDNTTYCASRIKPKNKKVELEIMLNTKDKNYSTAKGEQFALNVDSTSQQPNQRYYKSNVMDKQMFVSTNAAISNMNKHYAIGVIKSNQLHLTPLQNLLQLKPSFEYFDIYEKKVKDVKETNIDTDQSTEDEDGEGDKAELITIKYTKEAAKPNTTPQETEQNWIKTQYINYNKANQYVIESNQLLLSNSTDTVDVDSLNKDYSKLLLNLNTENQ